jgi:signal transduction histidine kinase
LVTISIKRPRYYSIRWKLLLVFLFISYVPLMFHFNTILTSIRDYFQDDRERKLLSSANIIAGTIMKGNHFMSLEDESKWTILDGELFSKSQAGGYRILLFDDRCYVVSDSNSTDVGKTMLIPEVIKALSTNRNASSTHLKQRAVYAAVPIANVDSEAIGAVLIVNSIDDIHQLVSDIQQKLILYTVLTSFIMGVLVLIVSQVLIDPLSNILKVVQKMSEGHLNQRISVNSRDEYARLGAAFNEMAEKLEKVDKIRREFVSNVSHELKTPLSSMKVLSESILLQEQLPEETCREFLQDINSEVDRLTSIVNDLLQMVKLDQQELGMNASLISLNKMVSDIVKRLAPLAEQKSIEILCDFVKDVAAEVDEVKMSSAISNLIDNAIKYTPDGGSVKVVIDADHQNAFVTVSDTGLGIAEEDQGKVFDRFYRVDKTRDRETGGTGLGLSITYQTMLLHNGAIKLTSKENEGSSFMLRIPLHYSKA